MQTTWWFSRLQLFDISSSARAYVSINSKKRKQNFSRKPRNLYWENKTYQVKKCRQIFLTVTIISILFPLVEPPEAFQFSSPLYGKEAFQIPAGKTYKCKSSSFAESLVGGDVFVQLAPSRSSDMTRPLHQAVTVWLEWVNATGFSACVETSGPSGDWRVGATPVTLLDWATCIYKSLFFFLCYAEKKSVCLLKNIQLIAFDTLLFLKFFSRFLAFLLHLFFCFLQLGSQCSLAGVSRSTNRLRSRSRRDSTLDNGKPTCSYCFPCGKLFPFCTYHLLTHGSTPGEPTGTQKKWYRFDISFFPHGRGELLSFGNDFAGPRGHTHGICSSFGQRYIALGQSFSRHFMSFRCQILILCCGCTYFPLAKGYLSLNWCPLPRCFEGFCFSRKSIPWSVQWVDSWGSKC